MRTPGAYMIRAVRLMCLLTLIASFAYSENVACEQSEKFTARIKEKQILLSLLKDAPFRIEALVLKKDRIIKNCLTPRPMDVALSPKSNVEDTE